MSIPTVYAKDPCLIQEQSCGRHCTWIWLDCMSFALTCNNQTVSSIDTFVLAMMMHPAAQKRAQKELDALLQGQRLPTLEDRSSLPYLTAVLKEVLRQVLRVPMCRPFVAHLFGKYRWQPVGPVGRANRLKTFIILNLVVRFSSCLNPRRRIPGDVYTCRFNGYSRHMVRNVILRSPP